MKFLTRPLTSERLEKKRTSTMKFLTRPLTSERLEKKGQKLYRLGKTFIFAGIFGLAFLLFLSLIILVIFAEDTDVLPYLFSLNADSGIESLATFLILISYIGILLGIVGIPMYINGLNIFALGRIAHNTEKE